MKRIIEKYGVQHQLDMCIEEMAELMQAINKCRRSGIVGTEIEKPHKGSTIEQVRAYNNLCAEVADVKIMLLQMDCMVDQERVEMIMERKIKRIWNKLNATADIQ